MRKGDIERELIHAEARIDTLQTLLDSAQADRGELKSQVTKLQDALVAARAPEAYRDQQIEREEANRTPLSTEELDRNRIAARTTTEFLSALEKPMFNSAEDLDDIGDLLARATVRNQEGPTSLHGNEES